MLTIGQKIICIDDADLSGWVKNYPKKGKIYSVREVIHGVAVTLNEISNDKGMLFDPVEQSFNFMEPSFAMVRFRPVDDFADEVLGRIAEEIEEDNYVKILK